MSRFTQAIAAVLAAAALTPAAAHAQTTVGGTTTPGCVQSASLGSNFKATAYCFTVTPTPGGKRYTTTGPVKINGLTVTPLGGRPLTIDITLKAVVKAEFATVSFTYHGGRIDAHTGPINWVAGFGYLDGFVWDEYPTLGGLKVYSIYPLPDLLTGGGLRFTMYAAYPAPFGGTEIVPIDVEISN
jgi:hypothetical protein